MTLSCEGIKKCKNPNCGRGSLPLSEFGNSKDCRDKHEPYCKVCTNVKNRDKYYRNHEANKQKKVEAAHRKTKITINDCSQDELDRIALIFWERVLIKGPDECWEYQTYNEPGGYGIYIYRSSRFKTHRLAFKLANGVLDDNLFVCHTCDNPPCCNRRHLFQGTRQDNIDDMVKKGRHKSPKGEDSPNSKVTAKQVKEIRELFLKGEIKVNIARKYGISWGNVDSIVRRRSWKDVA